MALICGNDARGHGVLVEDPPVAGQRVDGLLDPRAARVVEAHDGGARRHGALLALDDLGGVHLAERSAHGAEVLREGKDRPAVHHAVTRHDALAGDFRLVHAEVHTAMLDKLVQFHEGAFIEKTPEPLAGRQSPRGLHLLEGLLTAAELDLLLAGPHEFDFFFIRHGLSPLSFAVAFGVGSCGAQSLSLSSSSTPPVERGCTKAIFAPPAP